MPYSPACRAVGGRGEEVALVGDDARLEQRDRALPAEGLDVETAACGEGEDPLAQLARARARVGAADVLVALLLGGEGRAAGRALGRHDEGALGPVAQVDDRPDDLGDDVAGLAEHDGVADEHALALDLVGVVQRRLLDGRPGDDDRLHDAVGGDPAGATDVDPDVEQPRVDLLGWVLERDGPARGPRRRPELALERHLVDLDDDAVDVVGPVVAVLAVVGDELLHRGDVGQDAHLVGGGQSPGAQSGIRLALSLHVEAAAGPEAVDEHAQRTRGGDLRVLLAQRARGGVAGLAKGALPASTRLALRSAKAAVGKNTSPRISTSSGTWSPVSREGMPLIVRTLWVTSSPVRPSPRVRARTRRPCS